ncbi:MAG: HpcH/HpaI aldolase family protein [Chloroflexota bacterium]
MLKNTAKEKILAGQPIVGPTIGFPSPQMVEIFGRIGFDFVFIDCEHGIITTESCEEMVRAAEVVGISPLVRVPENSPQVILRYLDMGATSVQVPHVNTKADALAVVEAAKYAPQGKRGVAGSRWADYGLGKSLKEYVAYANEQTMLLAMIEDIEAVRNLDDILSVDGIDVLAIGPADLCASMGLPGDPNNPAVQRVIDDIIRRTREAGKAVGIGGNNDLAAILRTIERGSLYVTLTWSSFFAAASRDLLRQARGG